MITAEEYKQRRKKLMQQLGDNSIAVIVTNTEQQRNKDTFFPFRPNSSFYYLTGFIEPDAIAILIPNDAEGIFILLNRPRQPNQEIWDGHRTGQLGAVENFAADHAYSIETLNSMIPKLLSNKQRIFYPFDFMTATNTATATWQAQLQQLIKNIAESQPCFDVNEIIDEMRLIKSPAELNILRNAAKINTVAHQQAMKNCDSEMTEIQLSAELNYIYGRHNCLAMAYTPIVAAGKHACTLHHLTGNKKLQEGELVLIDMGEEYQYYASDVTRTFPINGKFSAEQKVLYELVLHTQLTVLATIKPGITFATLQQLTIHTLTTGLVKLGILQGDVAQLITNKAYFEFYMHNIGHWLGLDVHDVGQYKVNQQWRALAPGMVLTIEPGIYIQADNRKVDEKWRGIGIRIEDNIIVTDTGHENITAAIPRTVQEIEATMSR